MSIALNRIKNFWITKITALLAHKGVNAADLTEGTDWEDKLKNKGNWNEIQTYALAICQDIYGEATANPGAFPAGVNPLLAEIPANPGDRSYSQLVWDTMYAFQGEVRDLLGVMRDKIGVDPADETLATDADGNNILDADNNPIPKWKHDINDKVPDGIKLTDAPGKYGLLVLLHKRDLFEEIIDNTTGLDDLIEWGAINPATGRRAFLANSRGYNFTYKVDTTKLQEYKDAKNDLVTAENHIRTVLGLVSADPTPHDWHNQLAKKSDLDTATATIATLQPKADNYDRIHTKLNGKVSDSELDNLLQQIPQCSHTDYDAIKTERDQLKADQEGHSCDSKVQAKESEIITKIITDLGLTTERERERESILEAVITEIKTKLTPPTDNSKDNKITELAAKVANLQSPNSLHDLPISSEVKAEVIKISQELGLTAQSCAKLETATSYQELSTLQKEAFQEKLASEVSNRKSADYLNYGLGALTIGSLLVLAYMLMKGTKLPELGDKKTKE